MYSPYDYYATECALEPQYWWTAKVNQDQEPPRYATVAQIRRELDRTVENNTHLIWGLRAMFSLAVAWPVEGTARPSYYGHCHHPAARRVRITKSARSSDLWPGQLIYALSAKDGLLFQMQNGGRT